MPAISLHPSSISDDRLESPCVTKRAREQTSCALRGIRDKLEAAQETLERIELARIGRMLITEARQAATSAGEAEGMSLFEAYEAAKEPEKVAHDARALAYMWSLASTPTGLQKGIDMLAIRSMTGRLAAVRLVKHFDAVLANEFTLPK